MSKPDKHSGRPQPARKGVPGSARWFGELDATELEIDFYEQVLKRNPQYVQVLRNLGELLARTGRYDRSLEIDKRLVDLVPNDCVARYNLACSLAMRKRPHEAIQELDRAIASGYNDFGYLEVDPDLESLRSDPAYADLLRKYGLGESQQ